MIVYYFIINRQAFETIFTIHDEPIQRQHFEGIIKNHWLSGSVICSYLKTIEMADSLIMSDGLVNHLLDKQTSKYLDKIDINGLNFIAGPYLINNNHWLAFIVDMIRYRFILLDPLHKISPIVDNAFKSWIKYYNSRSHSTSTSVDQTNLEWEIHHVDHPLQSDSYNCGVFVIHFINKYINNNAKIDFDNSSTSLACDRQLIASTIQI